MICRRQKINTSQITLMIDFYCTMQIKNSCNQNCGYFDWWRDMVLLCLHDMQKRLNVICLETLKVICKVTLSLGPSLTYKSWISSPIWSKTKRVREVENHLRESGHYYFTRFHCNFADDFVIYLTLAPMQENLLFILSFFHFLFCQLHTNSLSSTHKKWWILLFITTLSPEERWMKIWNKLGEAQYRKLLV